MKLHFHISVLFDSYFQSNVTSDNIRVDSHFCTNKCLNQIMNITMDWMLLKESFNWLLNKWLLRFEFFLLVEYFFLQIISVENIDQT